MTVSREFTKFTDKFHQDSEKGISFEEWIDPKIKELSVQSKTAISQYLNKLVDDPNSDSEMEAAWLSGAAAYGVDRGEWRTFFVMLLSRFETIM